jgi:hypothetical protein
MVVTALIRSECPADEALLHLLQAQGVSRVFRGFTDDELCTLSPVFAIVAFDTAELVCEAGEPYTWAGLVISGSVGGHRAGSVIGEASLFTTAVCDTELIADEPGLLACTTLPQVTELAVAHAALALRLLKCFASAAHYRAMGFGSSIVDTAAAERLGADDSAIHALLVEPKPPASSAAHNTRHLLLLREWSRAVVHALGWREGEVRELTALFTLSRFERHDRLERAGQPSRELGLVLHGVLSASGPLGDSLILPGGYFGAHAWGVAPEGLQLRVASEEAVVARAPLAAIEPLLALRPCLMAELLSDLVRQQYAAAALVARATALHGSLAGVDRVLELATGPPPAVRALEAASAAFKGRAPLHPDPSGYDGDGVSAASFMRARDNPARRSADGAGTAAASASAAEPAGGGELAEARDFASAALARPNGALSLLGSPELWGAFLRPRLLRTQPPALSPRSAARQAVTSRLRGGNGGAAAPTTHAEPTDAGADGASAATAAEAGGVDAAAPTADAPADGGAARLWMGRHAKLRAQLLAKRTEIDQLDRDLESERVRSAAHAQLLDGARAERAAAVRDASILRLQLELATALPGGGEEAPEAELRAALAAAEQLAAAADASLVDARLELSRTERELERTAERLAAGERAHVEAARAAGYLLVSLRRQLISEASARAESTAELRATADKLRRSQADVAALVERLRETGEQKETVERRHLALTQRFLELEREADSLRAPPQPPQLPPPHGADAALAAAPGASRAARAADARRACPAPPPAPPAAHGAPPLQSASWASVGEPAAGGSVSGGGGGGGALRWQGGGSELEGLHAHSQLYADTSLLVGTRPAPCAASGLHCAFASAVVWAPPSLPPSLAPSHSRAQALPPTHTPRTPMLRPLARRRRRRSPRRTTGCSCAPPRSSSSSPTRWPACRPRTTRRERRRARSSTTRRATHRVRPSRRASRGTSPRWPTRPRRAPARSRPLSACVSAPARRWPSCSPSRRPQASRPSSRRRSSRTRAPSARWPSSCASSRRSRPAARTLPARRARPSRARPRRPRRSRRRPRRRSSRASAMRGWTRARRPYSQARARSGLRCSSSRASSSARPRRPLRSPRRAWCSRPPRRRARPSSRASRARRLARCLARCHAPSSRSRRARRTSARVPSAARAAAGLRARARC